MSEAVTFRDFAGAIMSNDVDRARGLLEALLGIESGSGPEFMMKAMSMRQVVEARDASRLSELLGELFGVQGDDLARALSTISSRY
jgi:hypothetical protein